MKVACKHIDRLVGVRLHPVEDDSMYELYKLLDGDGPVSWQMAQAVLTRPGCAVGIAAGRSGQHDEYDGLQGAAVLARALKQLGYQVTLYTDPALVQALRDIETSLKTDVQIEELAFESKDASHKIAQQLDICIFVEKPGLDEEGVQCLEGGAGHADWIAWEMDKLGKTTMGIGDNAGMIGFGKLFAAARRLGASGETVTRTATTYLYPVSNAGWGAYALTAALAIGMKRPDLALRPEEEEEMPGRDQRDGGAVSAGVVRMIKEMVDITLSTNDRKF